MTNIAALHSTCADVSARRYDEYFNPRNMQILMESIEQANSGQVVRMSLSELEAMEDE